MPIEDVIEAHRDLILELFVAEIGARDPFARPQSVAAMQQYVAALGPALRRRLREDSESMQLAREHGAQLARMHYDVTVLLREFLSLRKAIIEVVRTRSALVVDDVERVTDHVHVGMLAATREFMTRSSRAVPPNLLLRPK